MLFNSIQFFIFFPIVVGSFFLLHRKYKAPFLLLASYFFYMSWKPEYILLIILSTMIDYVAGLKMEGTSLGSKNRKVWLMLSLFSNLSILFVFKYYLFSMSALQGSLMFVGFNVDFPVYHFLLPVGISFYTFQTMSYSIDVYRGEQKAEKNFLVFALYVTYFPQLVAGPIERSTQLLPQLVSFKKFDYRRIAGGIKLMGWGLFKKVVIANNVAVIVDNVYNNIYAYETGYSFIIATVFFAFQIYCDFSGYSDIAIGASQVLGVDLMENFNRPYFATSIPDFWRRWHISLSTWFKDYLYIPLGGNRTTTLKWLRNMAIVFVLSGLWHGADWTFLVWGGLHAFYLIFGHLTIKYREGFLCKLGIDPESIVLRYLRIVVVFSLVCLSWVFFRANSIHDAFYILTHLSDGLIDYPVKIAGNLRSIHDLGIGHNILQDAPKGVFLISCVSILFMEFFQHFQSRRNIRDMLVECPWYIRWTFYYSLLLSLIFFGAYSSKPFIYFQF